MNEKMKNIMILNLNLKYIFTAVFDILEISIQWIENFEKNITFLKTTCYNI